MKFTFIAAASLLFLLISSCNNSSSSVKNEVVNDRAVNGTDTTVSMVPPASHGAMASAEAILARPEVPILCYHHIKDIKPGDGEMTRTYTVTPANFASQLKALNDSGYHSVLPEQVYNYLAYGDPLPEKPVMLTFDDTDLEQYTLGAAEMKKYGFKGVFFIMTISINRPRYMSKEQIKELSDDGHLIGCHTWDHHMVTKYTGDDWDTQLVKPRKTLEEITGKPIEYFAYPFGLWNTAAIAEIKKRDYKLAFSLSTKRDTTQPLFTVRRMIVAGQWSTPGVLRSMKSTFH